MPAGETTSVVVVRDQLPPEVGDRLLPPTGLRALTARGVYRIYNITGALSDFDFTDIDESSLVVMRVFASLEEARGWVERDARERAS